MPPKKVTPKGTAAKPAGAGVTATRKAPAKKAATATKSSVSKSTKKFIRNARGVNIRVTFDSGRRIQLNPRGQRGDMVAISKEELDDPIFLDNLGVLYEVVNEKDATDIREKQSTNASHPNRPETILTNELGQNITSVEVQESFEAQGKVVASLEENPGTAREEKSIDVVRTVNPARAAVPGSIDSSALGTAFDIDAPAPISERE